MSFGESGSVIDRDFVWIFDHFNYLKFDFLCFDYDIQALQMF